VGNKFKLIYADAIKTKPHSEFNERLVTIYNEINEIIDKYQPEVLSIEDLFFNTNTKTAIKVAQARGVLILSAKIRKMEVYEYTPLQIKQGVAGYGKATKTQVKNMLKVILNMEKLPSLDDITDSIAIAVCHAHSNNSKKLIEKYL
jgi:crossover junction endodeoxyribonuclease ruvC